MTKQFVTVTSRKNTRTGNRKRLRGTLHVTVGKKKNTMWRSDNWTQLFRSEKSGDAIKKGRRETRQPFFAGNVMYTYVKLRHVTINRETSVNAIPFHSSRSPLSPESQKWFSQLYVCFDVFLINLTEEHARMSSLKIQFVF